MSSYYEQPGYRRTGPEDVAGVVVLVGCAVFGFLWYIVCFRQACVVEDTWFISWGLRRDDERVRASG